MHRRPFSIKRLQDFRTMNRRRIAMGIIAIGLTAVAGCYLARGPRPLLSQHNDSVTLVETAFPAKRGEGLLRDNPDHVVPIICGKDGGFTTTIPATLADGDSNLSHLPAAEQIRRRRLTSPVTPLRPQFAKQFSEDQVVQSGQHTITMRPRSGSSVNGAISEDGTLIYRNAFPGTDVLYRSAPAKNEEFLVVKKAPVGELSWSWDLNPGELKPHQTKLNAIEFRNDEGTALLRIDPPVGRDAQGKYISAQRDLTIELVANNDAAKSYQMKMSLKEPGKWGYPIVIDPSLSSCASITSLRNFAVPTAVSMIDGKVLAFGGSYVNSSIGTTPTDTTWIFDPTSKTWTDTGASNYQWYTGKAVLLNDGRILTEGDGFGFYSSFARIYNPSNNSWSLFNSGVNGSIYHSKNIAKLSDGKAIIGGRLPWIFDPQNNSWSQTRNFVQSRGEGQSIAALLNGGALVCSGSTNGVLACEIWNPQNNSWTLGPETPEGTYVQSALGLSDGRTLLTDDYNFYILSADHSHWETYLDRLSSGGPWDAGLNIALHPSGIVIGQEGVFDSVNNQFHRFGFGTIFKDSPYLLPGNDKALWLGMDGSGAILSLKPVCADIQVSTHWNQPIDITLIGDAIGHSSTWTVSTPTAGQLTGQAPNLHFVPAAQAGTATFTYKAIDSSFGEGNTATVTINVTNSAPITQNQTISILHGVTATGTLTGSDPNGDAITYSVVTNGSRGTLSFVDNYLGTFRYVPNSNAAGTDQVSFQVTDGAGASATATLTINLTNQSPVLSGQTLNTKHNTTVTGAVAASDPDGEVLTFRVVENGTLGSLSFPNNHNSAFTYIPRNNISGTDTITVSATDGAGVRVTATITIQVTNQTPTATNVQVTIRHDFTANGTVFGNDADGDAITYQVVTNGTLGTLSFANPNAGAFTYVSNANAVGSDQVTVSVTDTVGATSIAVVSVTITNQTPTTFDQTFYTQRSATLTDTVQAADGDTDILTYSVTTNGNLGTLTFTNNHNGEFQYVPQANVVGEDHLTITIADNTGAFATAQVTISTLARNQQPTMIPGPDITALETSVANVKPQWVQAVSCGPSYESDQQVAEYLVTVDQPQWFTNLPAISVDGTLQFTPSGNIDLPVDVTMTIRVRDNGGTDNGGIDLSNPVTAVIHLTPVTETFTVTNTLDAGSGSLRNCLSLAHRGDTITFDAVRFDAANSSAATVINVLSSLPTLNHGGVTIDASDRRVTINGTAAGSSDGLMITSDANRIFGLTMVGFTGSGIALTDEAFSNQLGGSRTVGGGPNGQGLRIANNGTYGIRLSGTQVQKNAIVGCWIGVSANGTTAEPNLAGMLIAGGAHHNTIGSLNKDFANRIAGNTQEGIAIADVGSDYNIIIGNAIGGGKDSTGKIWTLGNGASGVYLSQGTVGTRVGASGNGRDDQLAANYVMKNGRYGIEVRSAGAKKHTFRGNHITGNALGGIGIFDGANNLIVPPIMTVNNGGTFSGTASTDGFVEFFNDQGDQGAVFLGRATVTNGVWNSSVSKDVSQNLTATFTDNEGNTSEFVMLAPASTEGNAADNSSSRSCGLGTGIAFMGLFGFFLVHLRLRSVTRMNRGNDLS